MTDKESVAIIDGDFIKFAASAAGEKRHIEVYNEGGQLIGTWKTRTAFKVECKESDLEYSDYTITDIQVPEPLANVLHTVKSMIQSTVASSGCDKYRIYLGRGDSFRLERSTLLRYKGNRLDNIRPLHLKDVEDYMVKYFGAVIVTGIEADDRVTMECYNNNNVCCALDKDYNGCELRFLNVNKPDEGIVNCRGFGKLWRDDKSKVRGYGRMFFYFQLAFGDVSDNYRANCMSDIKWGEVAAYNVLKDCKSDKEALTALVGIYKHLYPEPKTVKGWRGNLIEIDWLYVMSEVFDLARMLRWEGDVVVLKDVLDKLGVNYE